MSDPDVDAVLQELQNPSVGDPDADAVIGHLSKNEDRSGLSKATGFFGGAARAGLHGMYASGGGLGANPATITDPATWRGAAETVKNLPHTIDRAAATAMQFIADPARAWREKVSEPASKMTPEEAGFTYGPTIAQGAAMAIPPLFGGLKALRAASDIGELPKGTFGLGAAPSATEAAAGAKSVGAAEAHPLAGFENASPPLRAAAERAYAESGGINPVAAERHLQADSLPVPINLSEGQATNDPAIISNEMNSRATNPAAAQFYAGQNANLKSNLEVLRDQIGPDVSTTNAPAHADTLIQAYKDKDAPIVAEIDKAYKDLRDANGGEFPIDGKAFADKARAALQKQMRSYDLPPNIDKNLMDLQNGQPMDFESFEAMRTRLASEMRKAQRAGDGSADFALGTVRSALEDLPLANGAEKLKPIADKARALAKARFDALRADPAYNAAVNDTVSPDRFISKFVTGGERDKVALMRQNLADNPVATQTMGVAALHELRDAAKISPKGEGNFAAAGFARKLSAFEPKLQSLVGPENANALSDLADVAGYTLHQPRGSWVNNSNTWVSAAKDLGESMLDAKTMGLYSRAKTMIAPSLDARKVRQMTAPGAGLSNPVPPGIPKPTGEVPK